MTFEEAMNKLEEQVQQLETGEVSLETSLSLFEEGMKLAKFCHEQLANAEQKISELEEKQENTINPN